MSLSFLLVAFAVMLYMSAWQPVSSVIGLQQARNEATANLSSSSGFTQLTVTAADIASGKAVMISSHEVMYDGALYDIASRTESGGKNILKVNRDEKEESMLHELKDRVENWLSLPHGAGGKGPLTKQSTVIKDYFPADRFTFYFSETIGLYSFAMSHQPASSPAIAVPYSPPRVG